MDQMPAIVKVANLSKRFKNFTAVDNISFDVLPGIIYAFLGPNGAGKSTTIKILTTILHPTTGQVILAGNDVVKHPGLTRKNFGIVFQDPSVDDELTAWENMEFHGVLYGLEKKLRRERIQNLLTMVELWERRDDLVKKFSGGMKRRLEIARGLLHHPSILFLDEPTVGLDPQTRNYIWEYIKRINKEENVTVFFTTHYMDEVERVADFVSIIDHGRIVSQGTPQELKDKTATENLEDAFIKLTGSKLRSETAGAVDDMRLRHRAWRR